MQDKSENTALDYQSIFHEVNDAIIVLGLDTQEILDVNRPMEEMFGYGHPDALKLAAADLCAGLSPYTGAELLRRLHLAALGEFQLFEWMAKRANGASFWVEINLKLATLGGTECLLAVVRDIEQRKRTQQELSQSEQRCQAFLQQTDSGVCRLELDEPLPTHLTAEEQVEHIYRHAHIAECNQALADIYSQV